jgi:5-methyltetrahydropteroyltriglutamate--homocysteine methyltransferase
MKRSSHRILTTHAGSLIRTPEIIDAMIALENGERVDPQDFARKLRQGVAEVVRKQAAVGIDVVSDGEFGKSGWIPYVGERFTGLEPYGIPPEHFDKLWPEQDRFGDFYRQYRSFESTLWLPDPARARYSGRHTGGLMYQCTGAITYKPEALRRDIDNFKAALEGVRVEEAFLPVVAPCSVEVFPNRHYPTQEDFLFALAQALSVEYRMIADAGFLLQVDDAILPMQKFLYLRDKSLAEYLEWAEVRVAALNKALEGIPRDRVRYHICWGSQNVPHTTDPALADIIGIILKVNAGAFSIEAANPRHEHEWQVWQDARLPDDAILIPGMLSHCTNVVEHPELIAWRLTNFARLVGRENVIAGTDCGFSQYWNLIRVHPQVQWAKLEALVEGARLASTRLWGKAA